MWSSYCELWIEVAENTTRLKIQVGEQELIALEESSYAINLDASCDDLTGDPSSSPLMGG
jgi:hypothetical protein